ncbi:MAG: hypothetical protein Q7N87_00955 [Candidatus Uhrbacteria bacterium]|nr:hypothetical protein [Candidatus Uhrbacteria bacterium]
MKRIVLLLAYIISFDHPAFGEECASPRALWWKKTHRHETLGGSLNNPPLTSCVVKRLPRFSATTPIKAIRCQALDRLYLTIGECWKNVIAQTWQQEHRDQTVKSALQHSELIPLKELLRACNLATDSKVASLPLPKIRCILIYVHQ